MTNIWIGKRFLILSIVVSIITLIAYTVSLKIDAIEYREEIKILQKDSVIRKGTEVELRLLLDTVSGKICHEIAWIDGGDYKTDALEHARLKLLD